MDCVLGFYMKSPLEAWKGIDSEVHRMYMKKTKDWPKEKIVKTGYKLNFVSFVSAFSNIFTLNSIFSPIFEFPQGFFIGVNHVSNIKFANDNFESSEVAIDRIGFLYDKILNKSRLPLFLGGAGFFGKAAISLGNYCINGDASDLQNVHLDLGVGLYGLSIASQIYMRDRDPKVLEQSSVFTRAYNKVSETFYPAPEPVPARNYETLDNIVG